MERAIGWETRVIRVNLETGNAGPGEDYAQDYVFGELAGEGFRPTSTVVTADGRYAVVTLAREVQS